MATGGGGSVKRPCAGSGEAWGLPESAREGGATGMERWAGLSGNRRPAHTTRVFRRDVRPPSSQAGAGGAARPAQPPPLITIQDLTPLHPRIADGERR